jgi:hypothetical protein
MHAQQIRIPRNNHIRPSVERHFQKLVVFRVAALAYELDDGHELSNCVELTKENRAIFAAEIMIKLYMVDSEKRRIDRISACAKA